MDKLLKSLELHLDDNRATQRTIDSFVLFIQKLKSSRRVRFIYRGNSNLVEYYKTNTENLPLLAHYLFCLADKGNYFYTNKTINIDNVFSLIWGIFHEKVIHKAFAQQKTIERVSSFLSNNPEIEKYFSNIHNKRRFENLSKLPIDNKKNVADYYLSILHTIGKSANGDSYFLSSSSKYNVADRFKGEHNIIIFGWLPKKGMKNRIIKYTDVEKYSPFVKSLKLPTYQLPVYPEQSEICIKCGLLPHFILGFQHNNRFYINPNTLKQWHDSIVYDGLDIDQTEFNDLLNATKLKQSFIFYDGNYYLISNKGKTEV